MPRLIVCRNCTEPDCTYCNMNILAVALERGYFNSLMGEQHTVQIDSELVPVRHGHWKVVKSSINPYGNDVACSVCGFKMGSSFGYGFCPNCGVKMDEVKEDAETKADRNGFVKQDDLFPQGR